MDFSHELKTTANQITTLGCLELMKNKLFRVEQHHRSLFQPHTNSMHLRSTFQFCQPTQLKSKYRFYTLTFALETF